MIVVHFAWLLQPVAFCGHELQPDDKVATPLLRALDEDHELCEQCLEVERSDHPPEPPYDLSAYGFPGGLL